jgi:hypothetical protein
MMLGGYETAVPVAEIGDPVNVYKVLMVKRRVSLLHGKTRKIILGWTR